MTKSTDVLILSSQEGHKSLALSISSILKKAKISRESYIAPSDSFMDFYRTLIHISPKSIRSFYYISKNPSANKLIKQPLARIHKTKINKVIEKYKPKIIISTYFFFNPAILNSDHQFEFINVISDPRTLIPLNLSETGVNLVFDSHQQKICKKIDPLADTLCSGWFVRSSFKPAKNKALAKKKISVQKDDFLIVIAGGSEGMESILGTTKEIALKIKEALTEKKVTLAIICGGNKKLLQKIETIKAELSTDNLSIHPLGFIQTIHEYFQAADLVVGKAGPNSLFEAVATHTPFFATTHVHGHEDGNLEIIKKYKLGFVEENPQKAAQKILDLIQKPEELQKLQPHIQKMAKYNLKAQEKLLTVVKKSLEKTKKLQALPE